MHLCELSSFDFSSNNFQDANCEQLIETVLAFKNLKHLDLSAVGLSDEGL